MALASEPAGHDAVSLGSQPPSSRQEGGEEGGVRLQVRREAGGSSGAVSRVAGYGLPARQQGAARMLEQVSSHEVPTLALPPSFPKLERAHDV